MARIQLPNLWTPREYQLPLMRYMSERYMSGGRAALVWHRRSGKDSCSLNMTACLAHQRIGTYWHMLPTLTQAKKAVWKNTDAQGRRIIDQVFPQEIRRATNEIDMLIELKCGSMWQCVGSDNYDRLVGSNPVGVVFSEYSLADPAAWDYIRPILAENGGWAVFIFTPRGRNHGHDMIRMAERSSDWFHSVLTVDDTFRQDGRHVIPQSAIDDERAAGMPEERIQQEFYCDFNSNNLGAYYGRLMEKARAEGRIKNFDIDLSTPCETWWDIGIGDSTAIWVAQRKDGAVNIIDYYEANGESMEHYIEMLRKKPYKYSRHIAPHDIKNREFTSGKTRFEAAASVGFRFEMAPRESLSEGIDATRRMIPKCVFHEKNCRRGIDALEQYTQRWNDKMHTFMDKPDHDWTSHAADAFRMGAVSRDKYGVYRGSYQAGLY